jgi:hypothetical protein
MTTWSDESDTSANWSDEAIAGSVTYLVTDGGLFLIKDDGTKLIKDGGVADTLWWIDLTDNLQLEAVVDENGRPLGTGVTDTESGMQQLLITENDNSTSWSDE